MKELISNPLVSVLVITYNHQSYIRQCLDSILIQKTTFPFELIIGEDESSDSTREICIEYKSRFPHKINLILNKRKDVIYIDGKPTPHNNAIQCLKAARGKYIALCEGDDYWTDPYKLQKQVDFLEAHGEYSMCFHGIRVVDIEGNAHENMYHYPDQYCSIGMEIMAEQPIVPTCSVLMKNLFLKDSIPDYFARVHSGLDYALVLYAAQKGDVYFITDVMAVYRYGGGVWSCLSTEVKTSNHLKFLASMFPHFNKEIQKGLVNQICRTLILVPLFRQEVLIHHIINSLESNGALNLFSNYLVDLNYKSALSLKEKEEKIQEQNKSLIEKEAFIQHQSHIIVDKETQLNREKDLDLVPSNSQSYFVQLLNDKENEIGQLRDLIQSNQTQYEKTFAQLQEKITSLKQEISTINDDRLQSIETYEYHIAGLRKRNADILNSWSWRLTGLLRWVVGWVR